MFAQKTMPVTTFHSVPDQLPVEEPLTLPPHVWLLDPFCFTPWYTAALALGLGNAGAKVRLVCGPFLRERTYFSSLGLKPDAGPLRLSSLLRTEIAPLRRTVLSAETIFNTYALARSLRSGKTPLPDILHFQQLPLLNHGLRSDFVLLEAAQQAGIRVVHTVHNLLPHDSGERLRGAYAELYGRADHLVCHSTIVARRLSEEFNLARRKISVIPHGPLFALQQAPTRPESDAARARLALPEGRPVVLLQGVLAAYKGLDVLLDAWKLCLAEWNSAVGVVPLLLIAGAGPGTLEAQVRRAVREAGGTVRADLGYLSTARLPDYYAAADILVYPYHSITTSGALLTGLSYAKPIVASRLAPFDEYLGDGDNARLVPPGDAKELAAALLPLLLELSQHAGRKPQTVASPYPRSGYAQLSRGAEGNRSRYISWAEIAARTVALYRRLTTGDASAV